MKLVVVALGPADSLMAVARLRCPLTVQPLVGPARRETLVIQSHAQSPPLVRVALEAIVHC